MEEEKERAYFIDNPQVREGMKQYYYNGIPHATVLGIEFVSANRNEGLLKMPYQHDLIGNLRTGTVHAGVLISLLDSASGLAAICAMPQLESVATLDLRVDFMRPSIPNKELFGYAECYHLTNSIAFIRGIAYEESRDNPVATSVATFMRTSGSSKKKAK